jgi:hypothetical protein
MCALYSSASSVGCGVLRLGQVFDRGAIIVSQPSILSRSLVLVVPQCDIVLEEHKQQKLRGHMLGKLNTAMKLLGIEKS